MLIINPVSHTAKICFLLRFFHRKPGKKILDGFQEDIKSGLQNITMNSPQAQFAGILLAIEGKDRMVGLSGEGAPLICAWEHPVRNIYWRLAITNMRILNLLNIT